MSSGYADIYAGCLLFKEFRPTGQFITEPTGVRIDTFAGYRFDAIVYLIQNKTLSANIAIYT